MRLRPLLFGRFISALVLGLHLAWASFLRRLMLVYNVGLQKGGGLRRGSPNRNWCFNFGAAARVSCPN